jgi:WD40 repeat protein
MSTTHRRLLFLLILTTLTGRLARAEDALPADAISRLGTLQFRTAGEIKSVAFFPDGRTVAAASDDGLVCLFESESGKEIRRFRGHNQGVRSLAISPDGKTLASGSYDLTIRLWDAGTGKQLYEHYCPRGVALHLSFSPDGKTLASSHRNRAVVLIDTATGKEIRAWSAHSNWVTAVAFAPDGQTLATASRDRSIILWKGDTGAEIRRIETGFSVNAVLFSADGAGALAAGASGFIYEFDIATGKERRMFPGRQGSIATLARAGDTLASCGNDGTVCLWDLASGKERRRITASAEPLFALALSADGKRVATAAAGRQSLRVWHTADGKEISAGPQAHEAKITSLAFSPDGKALVAAGADRRLSLWSAGSGKLLHLRPSYGQAVDSLTFAPDGKTFAYVADDRSIRLCQAESGQEDRRFELTGPASFVSLTFANDGEPQAWTTGIPTAMQPMFNRFVTQNQWYNLYLTDLATNKPVNTFEPNMARFQADPAVMANLIQKGPTAWPWHSGAISSVSVSGDRATLATGSHDNTIGIWRMGTGKLLGKMTGHTARLQFVAFAGDDRTLVSAADDGTIRLWELATRTEVLASPAPANTVRTLTLSPDGRTLAWASVTEPAIHLWDMTAGKTSRILPGHAHPTTALAFAPDGRTLASGSFDTTILLWKLRQPAADKIELTADELEAIWTSLTSEKASVAYSAMWKLRAAPAVAVAFLKKQLKPTDPGAFKPVAQLIKELDDKDFDVRRSAGEMLERYGELAERELMQALDKRPPLEVVRRIHDLLFSLEQKRTTGLAIPDDLRAIRSVQVLEWIATPDACEHLRALAAGSPLTRQTQEAKASMSRLDRGL